MNEVELRDMKGMKVAPGGLSDWTLALALCGPRLETALAGPEHSRVSSMHLAGSSRRSSLLLAAIDLLVEDAEIRPAEITRIVVSRGPGSFTGIRSGLATALGLEAAHGARVLAFNSLLMQAARAEQIEGRYMTAQPGRRGEVYTRSFEIGPSGMPVACGEIEIQRIEELSRDLPWVASRALSLGGVSRAIVGRSGAEALIHLSFSELESEAVEAFYIEGPPIDGGAGA